MKYPFIENQTIEYNTLHCVEDGACQAIWVDAKLRRRGIQYKPSQVYGALQRLRKSGLIKRIGGLWKLCEDKL